MQRTMLCAFLLVACSDDDAAPGVDVAPDVADGSDASATTMTDGDAVEDGQPSGLSVRVVSGRADMVTGTTTLVYVEGAAEGLALTLDDAPLSAALHPFEDGVLALVEGLTDGMHILGATRGEARGELVITAYPITGPVFSGPHEEPFSCNTVAAGLGVPLDGDCSGTPVTVYFRKTPTNTFEPLADPDAPPVGTPMATTLTGRVVPFVIRLEAKTINRAIAWIASLHDPDLPAPTPWQRAATWHGGVIFMFGGGCGTGYVQGDPEYASGLNDVVGTGFVLVHGSLNTLNNNCNDVLSAETVMMIEEDFVERYGEPDYVVGFGGSGGSIQQHLIADNYPGLLDGLLPLASFPDVWSIVGDVIDCKLLYAYFDANPELWPTEAERTAVTGFAHDATCAGWTSILTDIFDPSAGCLPGLSADAIYDADTNPDGARCTLQDHSVNVFGRDPETGFARRAWGNAGIQYGLAALVDGSITLAQFVHLNANVGGLDIDGVRTQARTEPDPIAVEAAYRTGRVLDGARLADTPTIDVRDYTDLAGDFHDSSRTWATRARLTRHGDAGAHVSFMGPNAFIGQGLIDAILAMDVWLRAFKADPDPDRGAAARRTKPVGDRCYLAATATEGTCQDALVPFATPRIVAGGPLAGDVIACARVPFDAEAYPVALSEDARSSLAATFPDGVCDWSAPPPQRVPYAGPWQRF